MAEQERTRTVEVDLSSLKAARGKMRTVIVQLEEGKRPHDDILHPAYKLSAFLRDALGEVWDDRASGEGDK